MTLSFSYSYAWCLSVCQFNMCFINYFTFHILSLVIGGPVYEYGKLNNMIYGILLDSRNLNDCFWNLYMLFFSCFRCLPSHLNKFE